MHNLVQVRCPFEFGECVNVVGSYRCHCEGVVDETTGNCVGRSAIDPPLEPVPVADDGKQFQNIDTYAYINIT